MKRAITFVLTFALLLIIPGCSQTEDELPVSTGTATEQAETDNSSESAAVGEFDPLSEKEMLIELKTFAEHLNCDCAFITHHTISGKNLTGPGFLERKDKIIAALNDEIKHGNMDRMAAMPQGKRTL